MDVYRGKVWKFGDKITTDWMLPGFVMAKAGFTDEDAAPHCMYANRPGWSQLVNKGDILVAGEYFGCGSSRNVASVLRAVGIGAVVAESTSRNFLRNAINSNLPSMWCKGISQFVDEGDEVEVDLAAGRVRNLTKGTEMFGEAWPEDSPPMQILRAGGLSAFLKKRLEDGRPLVG